MSNSLLNNKYTRKEKKYEDLSTMWGRKSAQSGSEKLSHGAWFRESKFAMFIHWGLYSEAAGIWRNRTYYGIAEWLMFSAKIPANDYAQLA